MGQQEWSRTLRRRGAVILALFAVLWAAVAASGIAGVGGWVVRIGGVAVGLALMVLALRPSRAGAAERTREQPPGWRRDVGLVNLVQAAAIVVTVVASVVFGVPELVPPVVCLLVGLHFVPLARLFDQPQYMATAAGLCVGAGVGLVIVAADAGLEASRVVVGVVAAGTLWVTSLVLAVRA